jgi:hypothetical protein
MGVVPQNREAKLAFYEAHIAPFTANAVAIGLTLPEVANLTSLAEAGRKALLAANEARTASKAATQAYYTAIADLGRAGKNILETIRTFAETTNNPDVYLLSQLPPPAIDSSIPPPGQPREFVVTLAQNGWIQLNWKCTNPEGAQGTAYEIQRKIGSGPFSIIGIAGGNKEYVDSTLPAGSTGVVYQVTGVRSGLRGPVSQVNVNFGVGGGGGFTVTSVTEGNDVKLAA